MFLPTCPIGQFPFFKQKTAGSSPAVLSLCFHHLALYGGGEDQLIRALVDLDHIALPKFTGQDLQRQRILKLALDGALERPGAVHRVVARVRDRLPRRGAELDREPPLLEELPQAPELDLDDPADVPAELLITEYGTRVAIRATLPEAYAFREQDGTPMALTFELFNSVDRTVPFMAAIGWFRFVCHNGLVLGTTAAKIRKAVELGIPRICAHKGFSRASRFGSPIDIGPAARRHADVDFVVYHSGYEAGGPEGPYTASTAEVGVNRLVSSLKRAGTARTRTCMPSSVDLVERVPCARTGRARPGQAAAVRWGGQRGVGDRLPVLRLAPGPDPELCGHSTSARSSRSATGTLR